MYFQNRKQRKEQVLRDNIYYFLFLKYPYKNLLTPKLFK